MNSTVLWFVLFGMVGMLFSFCWMCVALCLFAWWFAILQICLVVVWFVLCVIMFLMLNVLWLPVGLFCGCGEGVCFVDSVAAMILILGDGCYIVGV